jgi:hypothetical protein
LDQDFPHLDVKGVSYLRVRNSGNREVGVLASKDKDIERLTEVANEMAIFARTQIDVFTKRI